MDIIEGEDCIRREKILAVEMSSKEGEEEEEEEKEGRGDCLGKGGREKGRNEEKRRRATKGAKDPRSLSAPTLLFVIIYKVVILRIRARIDFYVDEFMRVPDGGRRVAVVRP